jgi:hypothetical protein
VNIIAYEDGCHIGIEVGYGCSVQLFLGLKRRLRKVIFSLCCDSATTFSHGS